MLATAEYPTPSTKGCPMVLGGPLSHVMAAKAVAMAEARQPSFQAYAQRVADNAKAFAEGLTRRGARLVTGGTDNHLVLLDVQSFGVTGRQAESACWTRASSPTAMPSPPIPTAPGTPAASGSAPGVDDQGFGPAEFDRVAELVVEVLTNTTPDGTSKAWHKLADNIADWRAPPVRSCWTPTRCIRD